MIKYAKPVLTAVAVVLGFAACAHDHENTRSISTYSSSKESVTTRANSDGGLTASDQSNEKSDVEISRRVRRAVTQDSRLSVQAKNVKIITRGGHVTLRGPVHNATERSLIVRYARDVAGAGNVSNQLEIQ